MQSVNLYVHLKGPLIAENVYIFILVSVYQIYSIFTRFYKINI